MKRTMAVMLAGALTLMLWGCAAQPREVRCDQKLEPINAAAPRDAPPDKEVAPPSVGPAP